MTANSSRILLAALATVLFLQASVQAEDHLSTKLDIVGNVNGDRIDLLWDLKGATLQVSTDLKNWRNLTEASSPFTLAPGTGKFFYRLAYQTDGSKSRGGTIHGTLGYNAATKFIALPGIEVYLREKQTGIQWHPVTTDSFGRFYFPEHKNGVYDLHWDAQQGWDAGVHPTPVVINNKTAHPGIVQLGSRNKILSADVTFNSGTPAYFSNEFFNINDQFTAVAGANTAEVNYRGEFALPVDANANHIEVATDGFAQAFPLGLAFVSGQITLSNNAPRIEGISGSNWAQPGETITLRAVARDQDLDPLAYRWLTQSGSIEESEIGWLVGPGSAITEPNKQDTPNEERLNIDRSFTTLDAGQYFLQDWKLNVHTHTTGTVTPMLLSRQQGSYRALWIGAPFDPQSNGIQTVPETGSFSLHETTNVYAGFFTAGSGSGIIATDTDNSGSANSITDHDDTPTPPATAGDQVGGFSHPNLKKTYAFEINIGQQLPTVRWKLPNQQGTFSVGLVVGDGKGGYDHLQHHIRVGEKVGFLFSGTVTDPGGNPVPEADVEINGEQTKTRDNGEFRTLITANENYRLTIRKHGYVNYSRNLRKPSVGRFWKLSPTRVLNIEPARDTVIEVPGSNPKLGNIFFRMPRNSLVGKNGAVPEEPVRASVATLDIGRGEAPGDWTAQREDGSSVGLLSYGTLFVEFTGDSGTIYNLANGSTAQLFFPVPPSMQKNAPANIPLWFYDESLGSWKAYENKAVLNPDTMVYEGSVSHLSTINADLEITSGVTLRIVLDHNSPLPNIPPQRTIPDNGNYQLRVKDANNGFVQQFDIILDSTINGLYRLPTNTDLKLELLDSVGQPVADLMVIEEDGPLAWSLSPNNEVNTGPDSIPAGLSQTPSLTSGYGQNFHNPGITQVILRLADNQGAPNNRFLTFKGVGSQQDAEDYYKAIGVYDNNGNPTPQYGTLGAWWAQNGFDPITGTGGVRTSFLNNNDLGSGRDMHFIQNGNKVAAYVTNYAPDQGTGPVFNQDPLLAQHAFLQEASTRGATVCMEYSPLPAWAPPNINLGQNRFVKFFVYNGGGAGSTPLIDADLDGYGPKHIPNLCMNCHGGSNGLTSFPNLNARFRELDLDTYLFPDLGPPNGNPPPIAAATISPQPNQLDNFKTQNEMVQLTNVSNPPSPIYELIAGWYNGGGNIQDTNYVPIGWQTGTVNDKPKRADLYHDVVATSCRTCHIAFDNAHFDSFDNFKSKRGILDYYVRQTHQMPHTKITYQNFWQFWPLQGPTIQPPPWGSAIPAPPTKLFEYEDTEWPKINP
jgi:hypothetical protein